MGGGRIGFYDLVRIEVLALKFLRLYVYAYVRI